MPPKRTVRTYEGVDYYPYRVRVTFADGQVSRLRRWAPASCYAIEAVCRELDDAGRAVKRVFISQEA